MKPFFTVIVIQTPYSVRMWENVDQNNSDYGHFLRSAYLECDYRDVAATERCG